jgi:hypothetical protein
MEAYSAETSTQNQSPADSQTANFAKAGAILEALACGRSACDCIASVRRGHGLTHCPVHADHTPSLNVNARGDLVLVHCKAGCSQDDVISKLREVGLWSQPRQHDERAARVETIWREAKPDDGTLSTYLHYRGLDGAVMPASIRLHRSLAYHENGFVLGHFPALIGRVQSVSGEQVAVQRVYLAPGGHGKADVSTPKKALAVAEGAMSGGAVRLAEPTDTLALTEGIETGLAVLQATGAPTWACVSATGLKSVELPEAVSRVQIWADHDDNRAGQNAARALAERELANGREVFIMLPPATDGARKTDWLDVLNREGVEALRQASRDAEPFCASIPHSPPLPPGNPGNGQSPRCEHLTEVGTAFGLVCFACSPEPEPRTWRIADLAPEQGVTLVYGDSGIGKSYLLLLMAMCIVDGRAFAGLATVPGRVLYIDAELDADEHTRRAYGLARGLDLDRPPSGLVYASLPASLATEHGRAWLAEAKQAAAADVVMLDSLTYACWGIRLSEPGEVGAVMRALHTLGTVITLDHTQWSGAAGNQSESHPFGSFVKKMAAQSMVQMNGSEDGRSITLRQKKSNFASLRDPLYVTLDHAADAIRLSVLGLADDRVAGSEQHMRADERVLRYLLGVHGATAEQIAEATDLASKTVSNKLSQLKARGLADNDLHGAWHARDAHSPFPALKGKGMGNGSSPDSLGNSGNAGNGLKDNPPRPIWEAETWACPACRGQERWTTSDGRLLCRRCHPPPFRERDFEDAPRRNGQELDF